MKSLKLLLTCLGLSVALSSCIKENEEVAYLPTENNLPGYTLFGEKLLSTSGYSLKLFMREDPFVGYNEVAVRLLHADSMVAVNSATVDFIPQISVPGPDQGTPHESPREFTASSAAYFGSITFIEASGPDRQWYLKIAAGPAGGTLDTVSFDISVEEQPNPLLYGFISQADNSTPYFVALRQPRNPSQGINPLELMIYKQQGNEFVGATDLMIDMTTEFNGVLQNSAANLNPINESEAHYAGQVEFSPKGNWEVKLALRNPDSTLIDDEGSFSISF